MQVSSFLKYGNILKESAKIAKIFLEIPLSEGKKSNIKIYTDHSRLLKRFPKEFIQHLRKLVNTMDKKTKNKLEKEQLLADILDNLQINLNLTPKDVKKSYESYRNQKRLQKALNKDK
jgi:aminopeptidase C